MTTSKVKSFKLSVIVNNVAEIYQILRTLRWHFPGKQVPDGLLERPFLGPMGLSVRGTCVSLLCNNMPQTACLVFNQIMVDSYAALLSCTTVVQVSYTMKASI